MDRDQLGLDHFGWLASSRPALDCHRSDRVDLHQRTTSFLHATSDSRPDKHPTMMYLYLLPTSFQPLQVTVVQQLRGWPIHPCSPQSSFSSQALPSKVVERKRHSNAENLPGSTSIFNIKTARSIHFNRNHFRKGVQRREYSPPWCYSCQYSKDPYCSPPPFPSPVPAPPSKKP